MAWHGRRITECKKASMVHRVRLDNVGIVGLGVLPVKKAAIPREVPKDVIRFSQ
jgi:hypothetical protein